MHLFFRDCGNLFLEEDGWHGASPAMSAVEGTHWGMGGARTDGGGPVTGPIYERSITITEKKILSF